MLDTNSVSRLCGRLGLLAGLILFLSSCSGNSKSSESDTIASGEEIPSDFFDSTAIVKDTVVEERPDTMFNRKDFAGVANPEMEFMRKSPDADKYLSGILPVIAREVPEYAAKLLNNHFDKFIVVDKASLRVLLYDKFGRQLKAYDMACAKNYGNKHKKADSRTPEGFFSVEGIYNSTDWLFTDDDGVTSKKKGQFGPRFIRLRIPTTSQIGIHGTCAPWSIGSRSSHGCIRITNEHILELVDLVEPGMPAIVIPGKRDRKVNREEGYESKYFPTAPKYAMTEAEKKLKPSDISEAEAEKDTIAIIPVEITDSLQHISSDTLNALPVVLPDSVEVPE